MVLIVVNRKHSYTTYKMISSSIGDYKSKVYFKFSLKIFIKILYTKIVLRTQSTIIDFKKCTRCSRKSFEIVTQT